MNVNTLRVMFLLSIVIMLSLTMVEAHVSGISKPPKFNLEAIRIEENGKIVNISLNDITSQQNKTICVCTAATYRALLYGIGEVWGDEIPRKDDIFVVSYLPSVCSVKTLQYIVRDRFKLVHGSEEIKNLSTKNIKNLKINKKLCL